MKFADGQLLTTIYLPDGDMIRAGSRICDTIIVTMENGQMDGVPWFEVWNDGKCVSKWNGAQIVGVSFD